MQIQHENAFSLQKSDEKSGGSEKSGKRSSQSSLRFSGGGVSENNIQSTRENILYLQRTVGNRAVTRLIQRKAKTSQPGDTYEQEADRVAERVLSMPEPSRSQQDSPSGPNDGAQIQRFGSGQGAEPGRQSLSDEEKWKRPEEETIQAKEKSGQTPEITPKVETQINNLQGGGEPLSETARAYFEPRFGQDFSDVRVHKDSQAAESAQAINARAYTTGSDVVFGTNEYAPETSQGKRLLAHELTHVVQQASGPVSGTPGSPIQKQAAQDPIQRKGKESTYVPYQIHVTQKMTREEFRAAAMSQIFGGVLDNVEWHNPKDLYVPENSPYTIHVDTQLLSRQRGGARKDRGIGVDEEGSVTGAEERAKTFHGGQASDEKSALMQEIDRRYYEALGDKTGTKIKAGEKGKSELWLMIRDEVLFQHEYIANLPPQVKKLIQFGVKGKVLTLADYDRLFAIAQKIEKMPPGQAGDYAGKVTATTTDFATFEASLDKYIAEMAGRDEQGEERGHVMTKLAGLADVYERYKEWYYFPPGKQANKKGRLRDALEKELQAHGFPGGVEEFERFMERFLAAFEQESANIVKDVLAKYAGRLYQESERYKDQREVDVLHQKLGAFRQDFVETATNAKIWNDYLEASEQARIPGQGHLRPKTTFGEAQAALAKGKAADKDAQAQIEGLAVDYPIFQENEGLAQNKRINKVALARASKTELGGLLQEHIQNRMKDIGEARAEIDGNPELIYGMEDGLMRHFYDRQGIRDDDVYDKIIKEKLKRDASLKLLKGVALAILAVALAVVSLGTATPAIIAAGAGIAGAGLGTYMALEEYEDYVQQKNLADVGLAKNPSMVWVVLAVVGAGFDVAGAFKGVKALSEVGKAARALDAGGELSEFAKAINALEKVNEIESKVARSIENAAQARKAYKEASAELAKALKPGKLYNFPGPFADPDVYDAVVKMARKAIKANLNDAQKFIDELRLARARTKLGELAPEEVAKAKQAWEEAKVLEAAEKETLKNIHAISWKGFSKGKLAEHYAKHGAEFAGLSQSQYLKAAKDFAAEAGGFQMEQVGNFLVKFDPATRRTLIAHIADREIRTFYIADLRDADPFQAAINLARQISSP